VSWSKVITEGPPTLGVNVKSFPPHCDQTAALCTSLFSTKASEFNPVCPEETIIGYQCKETTRSVSYVQYHTADSVEPTGTSVMDQSLSLPFFFLSFVFWQYQYLDCTALIVDELIWDCGFESRRGHGCFSLVSVLCCRERCLGVGMTTGPEEFYQSWRV
jgi:hypothetical protein